MTHGPHTGQGIRQALVICLAFVEMYVLDVFELLVGAYWHTEHKNDR